MDRPAPLSPWTFRPTAAVAGRGGDRYLAVLGAVLVGYAVMGRGFAYLGVPPLYVGEAVLGLGLVALLTLRGVPAVAPARPMAWLAVLVAAVALRAAFGAPRWGLDAARDAMIVGYAGFAFVVAGLVMARPERLRTLVVRYRRFVVVVVALGWTLHFAARFLPALFPTWPWAPDVVVVETKPGDLLVHLATATAFVLVGFQRTRAALLVLLAAGVAALMVTSRGGMLAFVAGMGVVALWRPGVGGRAGRLLYVAAVLVALAAAVDSTGVFVNDARTLSVEQLVENVKSLAGRSDNFALRATAEWRLRWWRTIVGYTFGGEHFLFGKGFGVNLANADGFRVDAEGALRSPHNAHLTVLARAGVPVFLLWLAVQGLWIATVARARRRAKRAGRDAWAAFFTVCAVFWVAALVNGSFDVYLEGPMGGVWFWTVFGLAMAGVRLAETHPTLLDGLTAHPARAPAPQAPWSWRSPTAR